MGMPTLVDLRKKVPQGGLLNSGLRKVQPFNVQNLYGQMNKSGAQMRARIKARKPR